MTSEGLGQVMGVSSAQLFETAEEALAAAQRCVRWIQAQAIYERWQEKAEASARPEGDRFLGVVTIVEGRMNMSGSSFVVGTSGKPAGEHRMMACPEVDMSSFEEHTITDEERSTAYRWLEWR